VEQSTVETARRLIDLGVVKTAARTLSHCAKGRRQRLPENPKRPNA
jgi:hypothetical protein